MQNDKELKLLLKKLGGNIQKYRKKANLTQENMAEGKYSIEYKYYQRIEYGEKNITMETIYKISKKLNIEPKDLFNFED